MKRIYLVLSFLVGFFLLSSISNALNAQACGQGVWMIGGQIGFNSVSSDGNSFSLFSFQPEAGYFVIDNLAIGTSLGLTAVEGSTEFGIGPFVRYYLWSNLFAQAGVKYLTGPINPFDIFDSISPFRYGAGVGYSFFVNSAVAIEPGLQVDFGDDIIYFGIGIGIQAFLGRE